MNGAAAKILVVDDEAIARANLARVLAHDGHETAQAGGGRHWAAYERHPAATIGMIRHYLLPGGSRRAGPPLDIVTAPTRSGAKTDQKEIDEN